MYLRTWDHIINQFIASFFIAGPEIINDIKAAGAKLDYWVTGYGTGCLLYTSPSPRDKRQSRMPSSA